MASMAFEAGFSRSRFAGSHRFEVLGDLDLLEIGGHPHGILVAGKANRSVLGHVEIKLCEKTSIPLGGRGNDRLRRLCGLASKPNVFFSHSMTMSAADGFMK